MMIMQPEVVTQDIVTQVTAEVDRKKHPPALERIRFAVMDEGVCAQTMHLGPFETEGPTVQRA
jgi:hypothetical protein